MIDDELARLLAPRLHLDAMTLAVYAHGELAGDRLTRADAHLAHCADCQAALAESRGSLASDFTPWARIADDVAARRRAELLANATSVRAGQAVTAAKTAVTQAASNVFERAAAAFGRVADWLTPAATAYVLNGDGKRRHEGASIAVLLPRWVEGPLIIRAEIGADDGIASLYIAVACGSDQDETPVDVVVTDGAGGSVETRLTPGTPSHTVEAPPLAVPFSGLTYRVRFANA